MRPLVRDILGDRRVALHAQALADILCWDLYAKGQNLSIVDLLGRQRSQVPIMAIAGYYSLHRTSINLISETRDLIALGCSGMKLKVGGMSVAEDVKRVKVVRDTGGSSFNLAVDANQAWSLKEAIEFANACESLNLNWIEEPVYWDDDINDLAILKKETEIPICAGQSEVTVAVEDVRDSAAHPGREIAAGTSENDPPATGHILATVVSHTFNDCLSSTVSYAKSLAGLPMDKYFPSGSTV